MTGREASLPKSVRTTALSVKLCRSGSLHLHTCARVGLPGKWLHTLALSQGFPHPPKFNHLCFKGPDGLNHPKCDPPTCSLRRWASMGMIFKIGRSTTSTLGLLLIRHPLSVSQSAPSRYSPETKHPRDTRKRRGFLWRHRRLSRMSAVHAQQVTGSPSPDTAQAFFQKRWPSFLPFAEGQPRQDTL